jgi:hypothetical protein
MCPILDGCPGTVADVDLETVKTVAIWAIVAIAVIGLLLAIVIKKILGKIISLLIAAILVFLAWQQRDKVVSYADNVRGKACTSAAGAVDNPTTQKATTFLGIGISLPDGWCS